MAATASAPDPGELPDVAAAARAAHVAGLCVVPPRQDGSKQPDIASWTGYQRRISATEEIARWYAAGCRTGLGVVCGAVSGGLECFEFDDPATYAAFLALARAVGLGDLGDRIAAGYAERTPGGGIHWLWRCVEIAGNTRLAARPLPGGKLAVLIETRGEGGYVVLAPSFGAVHPTGKPYVLLQGGVSTIVTITADERRALLDLARSFDETDPDGADSKQADSGSGRVGDDFNARADWRSLLEPAGWAFLFARNGVWYLRRPGKAHGVSATVNWDGRDRLRVFTSSTVFAPRMYDKFGAYAALHHAGDLAAAARSLAAQGYGMPAAGKSGKRGTTPSSSAPTAPLVAVPPFPVEALPPVARRFVVMGAEALGCPPDFVAPHLFAFAGAAAGNARKLRLKVGFEVAPIFWEGVVGRPGTVKSPALAHARRPLDALQREAWERFRRALEQWEEGKPAERGPRPRPEHYFATDTTTEAVAFALTTSRGLAVIHDEIAGWVLAFDAYKKGGDRQAWLSSWSGAPLKPNRKTGDPIYIPDPVVCVAGGIQPDVLPELAGEAARDDGFVPRLLLAWPDAEPAPWTDQVVAATVTEAMLTIVRALRLPGEETVVTTLAPAAYAEWVRWYDENRRVVAASRGLAAGWAAKAPVHLARIALVLHLLAHPTARERPLGAATLRDAIAVVEYFRAHLGRVLPAFGTPPPIGSAGLTARVLRILTQALPDWVGRAELAIRLGGHEESAAIGAALAALEAAGQAACRMQATGGRPREAWRAVDLEEDDPGEDPVRDKWEDVESPPGPPFSRNHVFTHDPIFAAEAPDDDPDDAWETWEEPL